jgi:hypothetical protein
LPIFASSSATWLASSRVGVRTSAWIWRLSGLIFSMIGMPKAAVLPVPVCAWPTTSRPEATVGIVWAWMGDGSSKPISAMAARIFLLSGMSPKKPDSVLCFKNAFLLWFGNVG